jgi:hypothetical protein
MALIIYVPVARTFNILKNILKKRINANWILKEREKEILSKEGYNQIKVILDNKLFL